MYACGVQLLLSRIYNRDFVWTKPWNSTGAILISTLTLWVFALADNEHFGVQLHRQWKAGHETTSRQTAARQFLGLWLTSLLEKTSEFKEYERASRDTSMDTKPSDHRSSAAQRNWPHLGGPSRKARAGHWTQFARSRSAVGRKELCESQRLAHHCIIMQFGR